MEEIEVGENVILSSKRLSAPNSKETIIDSGATLAYFPDEIHKQLVNKVMSNHNDLEITIVNGHLQCFFYNASIDIDFPVVTLKFENQLQLVVPPHDYLLVDGNFYCIGWQSSAKLVNNLADTVVLGDLVLSNKLVFYDLENQAMGWREQDCSSFTLPYTRTSLTQHPSSAAYSHDTKIII